MSADGTSRENDFQVGRREYRIRTERRRDGVVQAALVLRCAHEERNRLVQVLLFGGGGLVLAGLTGAWIGPARRHPAHHCPC